MFFSPEKLRSLVRNINYNVGSCNFCGLYHVQIFHADSEIYLTEHSSQVQQGNVTTKCVLVGNGV